MIFKFFIFYFKYKTIETNARAFLPLNISAVGSVAHYDERGEFQSLCWHQQKTAVVLEMVFKNIHNPTHKHVLNVLCFKLQCGSARTSRCGRRLSREKIGTKVL